MPTKIDYLDETWNPIQDVRKGPSGRGYHCTKIGPGCDNCWAEGINFRFGNSQPYDAIPVAYEIVDAILEKPLHWKKPRRIGVQYMSDLFHAGVREDHQKAVFNIIARCPQHTFFILTKRPDDMIQCLDLDLAWAEHDFFTVFSNVWLGVSVSYQEELWKVYTLLATAGARLWVSLEPLLGPVNLAEYLMVKEQLDSKMYPDWIVVGGESGPGARPMHSDWVRHLRDQCAEMGVKFYFKQWGAWLGIPDSPEYVGQTPMYPYQDIASCKRTWVALDPHSIDFSEQTKGAVLMERLGKKHTGRHLDGRTYDEMPDGQSI